MTYGGMSGDAMDCYGIVMALIDPIGTSPYRDAVGDRFVAGHG